MLTNAESAKSFGLIFRRYSSMQFLTVWCVILLQVINKMFKNLSTEWSICLVTPNIYFLLPLIQCFFLQRWLTQAYTV